MKIKTKKTKKFFYFTSFTIGPIKAIIASALILVAIFDAIRIVYMPAIGFLVIAETWRQFYSSKYYGLDI